MLGVREVVDDAGLFDEVAELDVFDDADDFDIALGFFGVDVVVAADGIEPGERWSWPCAR